MINSSSPRRALITRQNFSPFGNKLVETGVVNQDQMRQATLESRTSGRSLIEILESITGHNLSPELIRQYKKQQLFELKIIYGVDSLDPELKEISTEHIEDLIQNYLPLELCRRHQLVPLSLNQDKEPKDILVAMVDPDNLRALDDLGRILRPKQLNLRRMVITTDDYQKLIAPYLDKQVEKQEKSAYSSKDIDLAEDLLGMADLQEIEDDDGDADLSAALDDAESAPIISLVNKILAKALQEGVSDIHVEPQDANLRIRFRKDGVLQEIFEPLPKKIIPAVISRFKIIASLDIAERRLPQDGRIRRSFQGRKIDFRVNTIPSRYGEKVVLRILDNNVTQLGLDKLISEPDSLSIVQEMVKRPFGLILVTGPTGSGKTTTLYSALSERNDPEVNICTAEDPIEYTLPGLTQVQVIREKGMDFASILRAFLRQDPDVILVGETRDKETAKTAIEAALTGHLVLTTLHTNDAASAIARLSEMDVEPFMVSASLLGVVAQRLVRRVCPDCRIPYQPSRDELARFGLTASENADITLYKAQVASVDDIKAGGDSLCKTCKGVGYRGRCGVYEIMQITENLQSLITEGAPTERIKEVAVDEGMQTLLAYSLNLVKRGETTLDEVERVTFTDSGLESELKAKRKNSLTCRVCQAELKQEWLECPFCLSARFDDA